MPKYRVYITVYHAIDIEADNKAEALNEAEQEIWDDHIKDVVTDVEEMGND
jgi:fructose-1,6-bisphosphatase